MKQIRKIFLVFGIGFVVLFLALWLFFPFKRIPGHNELRTYLATQLTKVIPAQYNSYKDSAQSNTVIYVLGGSQKSLKGRLKTASQLNHQGLSRRILLVSRPGITEYDLDLHRNLTNDEWSIKQLTGLGVKPEDIELVSFEKCLFGTLTEANGLSEIAGLRGYKKIILVTSQCHTKRTWITFSKAFEHRNISIAIYAANDPVGLRSLFYEYLKLALYKNIILPNYIELEKLATVRSKPMVEIGGRPIPWHIMKI